MAEHWCDIHKTKFFKTANMYGYAHPIKDADGKTVEWCNEDAKEAAKLEPQPSGEMLDEHKEVIEQAKKSVAFDPTRKSIERQKSLDIAERWCSIKVQGGEKVTTAQVITVAGLFESFLENGITVEKKKKE